MKWLQVILGMLLLSSLSGCRGANYGGTMAGISGQFIGANLGAAHLDIFPLLVFPKPHQGPTDISDWCWNFIYPWLPATQTAANEKITWRIVEKRVKHALNSIGLDSTVWAYGPDQLPEGFVIVSKVQYIDDHGETSSTTTKHCREFVFVLTPQELKTDDRPASLKEFTYYYDHGDAHLPDNLADGQTVNTVRGGDHLFALIYRFDQKPYTPYLEMVADDPQVDHLFLSHFAEALIKERDDN